MSVDFRVSLMRVIKKGIIEGGLFDLVLITGADGEASAELFHSKRVWSFEYFFVLSDGCDSLEDRKLSEVVLKFLPQRGKFLSFICKLFSFRCDFLCLGGENNIFLIQELLYTLMLA